MHSNDRHFIEKTNCFSSIGHVCESNEKIEAEKFQKEATGNQRKIILGDDLGANRFVHLVSRLEFADMPYIRRYGIKPFILGEYIFYPPSAILQNKGNLKDHSRGGIGIGLSIPLPIGDMLNI